jgi:hypothetical protein
MGLLLCDREMLFAHALLTTFGEVKEYRGVVCPVCEAGNDIEVDVTGIMEITGLDGDSPTREVTGVRGTEYVLHAIGDGVGTLGGHCLTFIVVKLDQLIFPVLAFLYVANKCVGLQRNRVNKTFIPVPYPEYPIIGRV